jgi:hypothetical protein
MPARAEQMTALLFTLLAALTLAGEPGAGTGEFVLLEASATFYKVAAQDGLGVAPLGSGAAPFVCVGCAFTLSPSRVHFTSSSPPVSFVSRQTWLES